MEIEHLRNMIEGGINDNNEFKPVRIRKDFTYMREVKYGTLWVTPFLWGVGLEIGYDRSWGIYLTLGPFSISINSKSNF